jgi:LmbE family N-acetylglucosaminyl deacetylase
MDNPMKNKLKILAIFPHPDDSVIFAGASLNKWIQEGHMVTAVCCTDGEVGTLQTSLTKKEVGRKRTNELLAANRIIGIEHLEMLHHPDGGVMDIKELRKDLFRCVRKYKPDRVLSMDPWAKYEIHPDHRAVGRMGAEAAAFAGFHLLYPEQLNVEIQPHFVSEVWFMGLLGHPPNCYVDVTSTIGNKVEALLQFETTMSIISDLFGLETDRKSSRWDDKKLIGSTGKWIRAVAEKTGKKAGLKAAEAFYIQKCLPGHFDNMHQITDKFAANHDESPLIN